ncbi:transcription termination/antitermination factor NusG [Candidatus Berkelbacteria bacterium]|nr:transcription termination/antitermination factor NusG [Candidatus Berkelbacteria bacterium]
MRTNQSLPQKSASNPGPDGPDVSTELLLPSPASALANHRPRSLLGAKQAGDRGWYVIHTYTGYEDQVADTLRQRVESLGLGDAVFDIIVPTEKQIEIKNGKRRTVERKIFPGYVLVEMEVTDESWYIVRNTPNVTGFIGLGVRPTPIPASDVDKIKKRMGVDEPKYQIDFAINDLVTIIDGPLKGFQATVNELDEGKGKVKVLVNMFGRETPALLDFLQVKKV